MNYIYMNSIQSGICCSPGRILMNVIGFEGSCLVLDRIPRLTGSVIEQRESGQTLAKEACKVPRHEGPRAGPADGVGTGGQSKEVKEKVFLTGTLASDCRNEREGQVYSRLGRATGITEELESAPHHDCGSWPSAGPDFGPRSAVSAQCDIIRDRKRS